MDTAFRNSLASSETSIPMSRMCTVLYSTVALRHSSSHPCSQLREHLQTQRATLPAASNTDSDTILVCMVHGRPHSSPYHRIAGAQAAAPCCGHQPDAARPYILSPRPRSSRSSCQAALRAAVHRGRSRKTKGAMHQSHRRPCQMMSLARGDQA